MKQFCTIFLRDYTEASALPSVKQSHTIWLGMFCLMFGYALTAFSFIASSAGISTKLTLDFQMFGVSFIVSLILYS